jgi:hypothetical protein
MRSLAGRQSHTGRRTRLGRRTQRRSGVRRAPVRPTRDRFEQPDQQAEEQAPPGSDPGAVHRGPPPRQRPVRASSLRDCSRTPPLDQTLRASTGTAGRVSAARFPHSRPRLGEAPIHEFCFPCKAALLRLRRPAAPMRENEQPQGSGPKGRWFTSRCRTSRTFRDHSPD